MPIEIEIFVETKINKMVRGGDSNWHPFLSVAATSIEKLDNAFSEAQNYLRYLYKEYQGTLSHRYIVNGRVLTKQQIVKIGEETWKK